MVRMNPGRRPDGRVTAEAVLQAAGEVFAEKGYDRATSKEICARAGANGAAVNYYFGGFEPLYDAVLLRAHERVMAWPELPELAKSKAPPPEKIERLIRIHLDALLGLQRNAWELRLIGREIVAPSASLMRLHDEQMAPRMMMIDSIIAEAIDLPIDHLMVRQAAFCTMTPCLMLLTAPPMMVEHVSGSPRFGAEELSVLTKRLASYAIGGLNALAAMAHGGTKEIRGPGA